GETSWDARGMLTREKPLDSVANQLKQLDKTIVGQSRTDQIVPPLFQLTDKAVRYVEATAKRVLYTGKLPKPSGIAFIIDNRLVHSSKPPPHKVNLAGQRNESESYALSSRLKGGIKRAVERQRSSWICSTLALPELEFRLAQILNPHLHRFSPLG